MNPLASIEAWFERRGWTPFEYQRAAWRAHLEGRDALIHAPTGAGKTLAAWLGPIADFLRENPRGHGVPARKPRRADAPAVRVLWITPMRALASDTLKSLQSTIADLAPSWTLETRTGDTSSSVKLRQRERLPTALVTTPESLNLLLSYPGSRERFGSLRAVIVDEWHELMGSRRGVQTELALARLRSLVPGLRTCAVSATLGNLREALETVSASHRRSSPAAPAPELISADLPRDLRVETLIPEDIERFPWAGHLGLRIAERVAAAIEAEGSTLLFTNTRSQAELWFRELVRLRPDWIGSIALHHGSLDRALRTKVESRLKEGALRCVVCTSSLDLGVDFSPVEQVIQVGSPKGVARLMQRAGRSGHRPGAVSRVLCVPAHAFELVEFAAARHALNERDVESKPPLEKPLDVLAQHAVTLACAEPFDEAALFEEARSTRAYRDLTTTEWGWVLDFIVRGGAALRAYPQYARVSRGEDGLYRVASDRTAREHRLNIGTISADTNLTVKLGRTVLGSIEESFIARLAVGDRFLFAGQTLQLARLEPAAAVVKKATATSGVVPRWAGGQMSLSSRLAGRVRALLHAAAAGADSAGGAFHAPEMIAARPLLDLQSRWSRVPGDGELVIEQTTTREGNHTFLFPFEGRSVHEGLGAVIARRLARLRPVSILVAMNDYGLELLTSERLELDEAAWRAILTPDGLLPDMIASVNTSEMTRRRFRTIARVAGLINTGFPGGAGRFAKGKKQVQASADLFFDVFAEFDPANLLLDQAKREVIEEQLEVSRLSAALTRLSRARLTIVRTDRLTPLAFPLWAESLRTQQVSSERWSDRVRRMSLELEKEASAPKAGRRKSAGLKGR